MTTQGNGRDYAQEFFEITLQMLREEKSAQKTAICLESIGLWALAVTPDDKPPLGRAWGTKKCDNSRLNYWFRQYPRANVGLALGPGKGPAREWLIDLEGDGPKAEETLLSLMGGEEFQTLRVRSRRGPHYLAFADGERLDPIIPRLKGCEGKGHKAGVYHLSQLPDLELRFGGLKPDGTPKQIQSLVAPSTTDGFTRSWDGPPFIAWLPDAFYENLSRVADEVVKAKANQRSRAKVSAARKKPRPEGSGTTAKAPSRTDRVEAYIRTAVAEEAAKVSSAVVTTRHNTLRDAAYAIAGFEWTGHLDWASASEVLRRAGEDCGLPEEEIDDLISSGWEKGKAEPRKLQVLVDIMEGRDDRQRSEGREAAADFADVTVDGEPKPGGKRPDIEIDTLRHAALRQTLAALRGHPDVYCRGKLLVTVAEETAEDSPLPGGKRLRGILGSPKVIELSEARVGCLLTEVANFFKWAPGGDEGEPVAVDIHPPAWLVKAVATHGHWPGVRPLVAIAECPYPRDDGSIVQERGYDPETGTLYLPSMEFPPIPDRPTQEDAKEAAKKLLEPVRQFPFASDQDRAVYLAGVLTAIARVSIPGPVPGIAVNGNAAGTGKGLFIDTIANIGTGRNAPTSSYPEDKEEAAKVKVAIAIAGKSIHHFDNLDEGSTYGNSALDSALTADEIDDRILGSSRMTGAIPMRVCFFISGNNIAPGKDAHRRWLVSNLVTDLERPEERDDLEEKNLRDHVRGRRGELVKAALTILRAHALEDRPTGKWASLGSFETWDRIVRGAIWWATGLDCCATRKQAAEDSPERAERLAVLEGWAELPEGKGEGYTVADAVKLVADTALDVKDPYPILRSALNTIPRLRGRDGRPSAAALGYYIRGIKGRNIGGMMFVKTDTPKHQAVVWRVDVISPKPADYQNPGEDTRMREDATPPGTRGQDSDTDVNMNGEAPDTYRPEADDPPASSYPPRRSWVDPDYAGVRF